MAVNQRLLFFLLLGSSTTAAITLAAACGGTDQNSSSNSSTSSSSGNGGAGGTGGGDGGGIIFVDGGSTCKSSTDCNGQLCIDGICCDAPEHICAGICCSGGTVCLSDKCVLPGKNCQTANDCDPGQYCETALGDNGMGDGGTVDDGGTSDGGPTCTQAPPLQGKCLDQPPKCDTNGNPPGCTPPCEYKPAAGQLNAKVKWAWDQSTATYRAGATDVWSTPTVGRVYDGNCDGKVDELDAPSVIFVSGRAIDTTTGLGTCCHCTGATNSACLTGALRVLDGRTGAETWTLDKAEPGSIGFAGASVAIADIDKDGRMDIAAVTGEGFVVVLDAKDGTLKMKSDKAIANAIADTTFGWGGGLAIADMDHDGFAEIAYANSLFTTAGGTLVRKWVGTGGIGGGSMHEALSTFVDLDGAADGNLELLAGKTAYKADGTALWDQTTMKDGFPAVGDLDGDGKPEVIVVGAGNISILDPLTGVAKIGPVALPGNGAGGPPTVADFDGDKKPEIGVAQQNFYTVLKPNLMTNMLDVLWKVQNHDLSSSVTGSSVFDFEGDGRAEVIYADECFLWVYDGATGAVRFSTSHTSFTGTEASLVADVDGDGRSEIVMVSNSADPSANGWKCMDASGNPTTVNGATWTPGTAVGKSYRGITLFGDKANSWVGTRTIWNEHTYHVTNICDSRDSACDAPNLYGSVPMVEKKNWTLPWLNDFRQNVQDKGIFDAPDATLSLTVQCSSPLVAEVSVRNIGLASLPAGAVIGIFEQTGSGETQVGTGTTTHALLPGQTEKVNVQLMSTNLTGQFIARIIIDPMNPTFHECREDNNESAVVKPGCVN